MTTCFMLFIIPCHNVQYKVGRMLDSILNQDCTDYHVVCVDDCSSDNTLQVLQKYKGKFKDKMTILENSTNLGPGETRNVGYYKTLSTVNSRFVWMVDADDKIADDTVLRRLKSYSNMNPNIKLIQIGHMEFGNYVVSSILRPHAPWGLIVDQREFVPFLTKNIRTGEDIYVHFMLYDKIPDDQIGSVDYLCYWYDFTGKIHAPSEVIDDRKETLDALERHVYAKEYVKDFIFHKENFAYPWLTRKV